MYLYMHTHFCRCVFRAFTYICFISKCIYMYAHKKQMTVASYFTGPGNMKKHAQAQVQTHTHTDIHAHIYSLIGS